MEVIKLRIYFESTTFTDGQKRVMGDFTVFSLSKQKIIVQ